MLHPSTAKWMIFILQCLSETFRWQPQNQQNWIVRSRGVFEGEISLLNTPWFSRSGSVILKAHNSKTWKLKEFSLRRKKSFSIRSWFLKSKSVFHWGAFFLIEANEPVSRKGFLTPGQIADGKVLHCHPALRKSPETPLERRSMRIMRIDRTEHQKSFHVAIFLTVAFLPPRLQPMTGLPGI